MRRRRQSMRVSSRRFRMHFASGAAVEHRGLDPGWNTQSFPQSSSLSAQFKAICLCRLSYPNSWRRHM